VTVALCSTVVWAWRHLGLNGDVATLIYLAIIGITGIVWFELGERRRERRNGRG
jgi:uncharacterized membrane protein